MSRSKYSLQLDSVICARCGAASRAEDDTCPQCGADREGAIFSADALRLAEEMPRAGWLVTKVRRNALVTYPSIREEGDAAPAIEAPKKRSFVGGVLATGGVVVIGFAAGAFILANIDTTIQTPRVTEAQSSGGSIAPDPRSPAIAAARRAPPPLSRGAVAATLPAAPEHVAAASSAKPATTTTTALSNSPGPSGASSAHAPSSQVANVPPAATAAPASPETALASPPLAIAPPAAPRTAPPAPVIAETAPRDAQPARSASAARKAIANRDLAAARRYIDEMPGSEQSSPDVQRVATRLTRLESQRDAALQRAKACPTKSSACVARHANQALALDARNPQALALARRVSTRTKPAPARPAIVAASPVPAPEAHPNPPKRKPDAAPQPDRSFTWFGWGVPTVAKGRGDAH
ncbi:MULTISPECIES: hypothetical protein [unclassified Caballeronia]|uniref:hypothetical protein n=1 Tax=unclassified Caballeronia TaxID=2646786 RepID=UPI0028609A54|nr:MULTISPECIES: hypothetical protein [unclassified Caballeronia]MDR5749786.1 hypothetical protein [Caballeronia sp. LZ024]MDR5843086.1 hypothetical protein [Caballeronia sp. LZ031]